MSRPSPLSARSLPLLLAPPRAWPPPGAVKSPIRVKTLGRSSPALGRLLPSLGRSPSGCLSPLGLLSLGRSSSSLGRLMALGLPSLGRSSSALGHRLSLVRCPSCREDVDPPVVRRGCTSCHEEVLPGHPPSRRRPSLLPLGTLAAGSGHACCASCPPLPAGSEAAAGPDWGGGRRGPGPCSRAAAGEEA